MDLRVLKDILVLQHPFLREMRVRQWTKNLIVLAPLFFAIGDESQQIACAAYWRTGFAAFFFCLLSSGIYVFNDIVDRKLDKAHPVKRKRPVAAGEISIGAASAMALILSGAGIAGALIVSVPLAGVMSGYLVLQLLYTLGLKHVALVDVFFISFGFVIRALAGGAAAGVSVSFWLLICTFLMALFLGLCKRRHEKIGVSVSGEGVTRPSLGNSEPGLFDQLIAVTASATIVSYAAYTQWPDTVAKFGTHGMGFTIPFVVFGVFRYMDLVYRHSKGDQPEQEILTDKPLIADIVLYAVCVAAVFRWRF